MPLADRLLSLSGLPVHVALVVLLFRTRLYTVCLSFTVYVITVPVGSILILGWPEALWNWRFWTVKETVYVAMKLGIAFELVVRAFRGFPGASAVARRLLLVGCLSILATLLVVEIPPGDVNMVALYLLPWAQNGIAALLILLWILTMWYRVPIHPIYRAILRGLVWYVLVATVLTGLLARSDGGRIVVGAVNAFAWIALMCYWVRCVRLAPRQKREEGTSVGVSVGSTRILPGIAGE